MASLKKYSKVDSVKLRLYDQAFRYYGSQHRYNPMELYLDSVCMLSAKLNFKNNLFDAQFKAALFYHSATRYSEALSHYQEAYQIASATHHTANMARVLLNTGAIYMDSKDYVKALEKNQQAISLYEKLGKKREVGSCYMNIAEVYMDLNQFDKAFPFLTLALSIFVEDGPNTRGVGVASEAMGIALMKASDKDLIHFGVLPAQRYIHALEYFKKALPIAFTHDDPALAASINANIGEVYGLLGDHTKAQQYFETVMNLDKTHEYYVSASKNKIRYAEYFLSQKNYNAGLLMARSAVSVAYWYKIPGVLQTGYELISKIYEKSGRYDSAYLYFKQYIVIKDSLFNAEKEREITRKQLLLDFELKEKEYKYNKQLLDNELKQQVLLAATQRDQLELAKKEKDVQQLIFLQQRTKLQNEASLQAAAFQQQKDKSDYLQAIAKEQIDNQRLELRFNKYLNLFFLISVIVLLIVGTIIFYSHRKAKKLNLIISEQKNSLQELVNVKDQLLGTISHDMRTPINSLMAFAYLLDSQEISQEKLKKYTAQLKNTLGYTQELLDNLLRWATSQMRGFVPEPVTVNLAEMVDQVLVSFSDAIIQKQLVIKNNIPRQMSVWADQEMLLCVMRNLISNAIKFSYANKTIAFATMENTQFQVLCIKDEGIGVSKEKLCILNQASACVVNSSIGTSQEKGNGLGVLLCKSFVQMMKGELYFFSEQDKGTEVRVFLPPAV
ncbi:MAG: tetratricopeptide repeat-containing sensor histidine kinase [Chitinophagaceae bacterium]|nr:tetratricopeptide repeat-containing sensor histidine kinase [Chitinophagaceae bacterium]